MTTDNKHKESAAITPKVLETAKKRVETAGVAWPEDHKSKAHERAKSAREEILKQREEAKSSSRER